MSNKSVLLKLYDTFIGKAVYYEGHPYFPAYCMNATARTYREAAAIVEHELEVLCNGKSVEEIRSGEQADPRPDGATPAAGGLSGGGETAQGGPGQEEG